MAIYLKNTTYIDWQTLEFVETNLKVNKGDDGKLEFIREIPAVISDTDIVIDCKDKLVTKSFACGHHHIYSALARGMTPSPAAPKNFFEILKFIWWELDKKLDAEMIKASALVTGMYCAKNGVTFVIDHHSSPFAVEGSLEIIAGALDEIGLSHLLCIELSDRDGEVPKEKGLSETENYIKSGRQGLVGLHASFTVGDDLLKKSVALSEKYDSGIHIHTAEDSIDQEFTIRDYGKRIINRFNNAGVMNFQKTILAHCVNINMQEREILKNSNTWIVQNAESNMNNNVGSFNSYGLNENIFYGTDGMHSDMLRSAKSAFLVGREAEEIQALTVYQRLRNVHNYLNKNDFKGDGENNLVILNYDSPTEINKDNFIGHFIFGIESSHIESVISKGKLIVQNKKLININEEDILAYSKEMSKKLWSKLYKN
ncbi:MAG TPA: amidohydrolase family protein [Ignavibacteria bacterium]